MLLSEHLFLLCRKQHLLLHLAREPGILLSECWHPRQTHKVRIENYIIFLVKIIIGILQLAMVQSVKPFILDDSHPMDIRRMTGRAVLHFLWRISAHAIHRMTVVRISGFAFRKHKEVISEIDQACRIYKVD